MSMQWAAAGAFVFCLAIGLMGGKLFHLEGPAWYAFLGLMGALGLGASALIFYFQSRRQGSGNSAAASGSTSGSAPATSGSPAGGSEIDQWIREANARLAQSKRDTGIANLPMIFVAGDRGTAKTSTILNSGIDAELLAGQVYQGNQTGGASDGVVTPTRGANLFFARGTVFVEAGGALLAQPGNWKSLVARLQPARLKSLMGGGAQAPRGVLLCFDIEAFTRAGAADSIANAARYLRDRLGEISQVLGIRFPVYVLFTRMDRVAYFSEFVRNLTPEEAGQAVGVSLPIPEAASEGVYAEAETNRLGAAFDRLVHSLCDQRTRLLPRETDASKIPAAYEFPREFRKLRNLLVQFLVDVARPSQLRASPFLRGFYFSGVRPVEVRDQPPAAPQAQSAAQASAAQGSSATGMFRAGVEAQRRSEQAGISPGAASSGGGTRRVPQWLFLSHLFNDVILADNVARAASGSSVKTSFAKRVLLASAAGLCLVYAGLLLMSYLRNRDVENTALTAVQGLNKISAALPGNAALPAEDSLRRLETLRQSLAQLTDWNINGAPLGLRFGLYTGDDLRPLVRRAYYAKFRQLLFGSTQDQLLAYLRARPSLPGPGDDYGYPYDTLKTYLLTTSEWARSSDAGLQGFLGSRLLTRWSNGRDAEIGPARADLAKLQFDFYARDLHNGNPYSAAADASAVDRSRSYLSKFSGIERVYRSLLAEADKGHPPTSFNQTFAGTGDAVASTVPVDWAFTRDGWKFVQDRIKKQDFGGEPWVLGASQNQAVSPGDLERGIRDRYAHDYIEQWRGVMNGSHARPYANLQDASAKLTRLTQPDAPLLHLIAWVSDNTNIDLPGVPESFRAVQAAVPPGSATYIPQQEQGYNRSLIDLQTAVDRNVRKEPDADRAMRDSQEAARATTRGVASAFPPDAEAHLEARTLALMLEPITNLDNAGPSLAGDGRQFCTAFNAITSRFPFNPSAQAEVTLDELGSILRPKTGKLWTFYDSTLKNALQCQNGTCTAKGSPPLSPAFVSFISQLMKFSMALYGDAGTEPDMSYSLRPLPSDRVSEFAITVNGEVARLKANQSHTFKWPGQGTRGFVLTLKLGGADFPTGEEYAGNWALFRFFADADRQPAPNTFLFVFRTGQQNKSTGLNYSIAAETGGGPAVFSKDFLSTLKSCVVPGGR